MKTPEATYQLLIALCSVNDGDIFESVALQHPEDYSPSIVRALSACSKALQTIIDQYDFAESEAFFSSLEGKSASVAGMFRKLASDRAKRKDRKQDLIDALMPLPASRDVFRLLDRRHHHVLNTLLSVLDDASRTGAEKRKSQ